MASKLLFQHDMVSLGIKLAAARKDPAKRCAKPRTDEHGETHYNVDKPKSKSPLARDTGVDAAYGPHGVSFLAIDPDTGEVKCGACEGQIDATAQRPTYRGVGPPKFFKKAHAPSQG